MASVAPGLNPALAGADPTFLQAWDYATKNYGGVAWMLSVPLLQQVVLNAASQGWDDLRLQGALEQTRWWKSHSAASRAFLQLRYTDPAEAERQAQQEALVLREQATKLGLTMDEQRSHDLAVKGLLGGWDAAEFTQALNAEVHYQPGQGGQPATEAATLKAKAAAYAVPLSDGTVNQWVTQITNGSTTEDSFDEYLRTQAKSLFPSLASAIDAGFTVRQYADPYLQLFSKELAVAPDSIDLTDPKWSKFLVHVDPATGQRTAMNLDDSLREIRSNPVYGWQHTVGAQNMVADFGQQLGQMFGRVA